MLCCHLKEQDISNFNLQCTIPGGGYFKQLLYDKIMSDLSVLGEHGNLGSGTVNHVPGTFVILFTLETLDYVCCYCVSFSFLVNRNYNYHRKVENVFLVRPVRLCKLSFQSFWSNTSKVPQISEK